MAAKTKQKPYDQMNAAELAEATKEYDKPFAAHRQARLLTAAQSAMHRRAARRSARTAKLKDTPASERPE